MKDGHIGGKGRFLMAGRMEIWKARGASEGAPLLYVETADTFWRRFLGLMGRQALAPSHALLIVPCSGVQMCFMRFAIDVVFLKRRESIGEWQVLKVAHGLRLLEGGGRGTGDGNGRGGKAGRGDGNCMGGVAERCVKEK